MEQETMKMNWINFIGLISLVSAFALTYATRNDVWLLLSLIPIICLGLGLVSYPKKEKKGTNETIQWIFYILCIILILVSVFLLGIFSQGG